MAEIADHVESAEKKSMTDQATKSNSAKSLAFSDFSSASLGSPCKHAGTASLQRIRCTKLSMKFLLIPVVQHPFFHLRFH
jgi:hypothetical protein